MKAIKSTWKNIRGAENYVPMYAHTLYTVQVCLNLPEDQDVEVQD
jgi:hypothetical protein